MISKIVAKTPLLFASISKVSETVEPSACVIVTVTVALPLEFALTSHDVPSSDGVRVIQSDEVDHETVEPSERLPELIEIVAVFPFLISTVSVCCATRSTRTDALWLSPQSTFHHLYPDRT